MDFLALSLQLNTNSMTSEEALSALQKLNLNASQFVEIKHFFQQLEEQSYSPRLHKINFRTLESIAKVIFKHGRKLSALALALTAIALPRPMEASTWNQALQILHKAELSEPGSQSARLLYTQSALQFESLAKSLDRSAEAWSYAGNAWFQARSLGRALAAYRIAYSYRPFDALISENIQSIRAMIGSNQTTPLHERLAIPSRWLRPILLLTLSLFCGSLLTHFRFRKPLFFYITLMSAACLVFFASILVYRIWEPRIEGVVIADSTEARKGPGYNFVPAFNEAVLEGMEFKCVHQVKDWCLVHLHGSSRCWLHRSQVHIFEY